MKGNHKTWTAKELWDNKEFWPGEVYRDDFFLYLQELQVQKIVHLCIPLWLQEHQHGELDYEETIHIEIVKRLHQYGVQWLSLLDIFSSHQEIK